MEVSARLADNKTVSSKPQTIGSDVCEKLYLSAKEEKAGDKARKSGAGADALAHYAAARRALLPGESDVAIWKKIVDAFRGSAADADPRSSTQLRSNTSQ